MNEEAEQVIASTLGHEIVGGQVTEDGVHLQLDDGRFIVVTGRFIMGICGDEVTHTLQ